LRAGCSDCQHLLPDNMLTVGHGDREDGTSVLRRVISRLILCVTGKIQREGLVIHLIADRLEDYSPMLSTLSTISATEAFSDTLAHADEVKRPGHDQRLVLPPSRDFR